jgi:hypothetical protein
LDWVKEVAAQSVANFGHASRFKVWDKKNWFTGIHSGLRTQDSETEFEPSSTLFNYAQFKLRHLSIILEA